MKSLKKITSGFYQENPMIKPDEVLKKLENSDEKLDNQKFLMYVSKVEKFSTNYFLWICGRVRSGSIKVGEKFYLIGGGNIKEVVCRKVIKGRKTYDKADVGDDIAIEVNLSFCDCQVGYVVSSTNKTCMSVDGKCILFDKFQGSLENKTRAFLCMGTSKNYGEIVFPNRKNLVAGESTTFHFNFLYETVVWKNMPILIEYNHEIIGVGQL